MTLYDLDETNLIDMVEDLAEHKNWEYDRLDDDQIAMAIEGQWRTYSISLAWSGYDQILRMVLTFEIEPPEDKLASLYELLNQVNDQCWTGAFTFWKETQLMVYRYGLILAQGQPASSEQIDTMINTAVLSAERFYPAFQIGVWGNKTPKEALQIAIAEAYGHA